MTHSIDTIYATTAAEFWRLLSPEKPLFPKPCKLLYRGQRDECWHLTPGILRRGMSSTAGMQLFKEWAYIETFVRHCDSIGLPIPNDSPAFREKLLNQGSPIHPAGKMSEWPPAEMHQLIALAQHYRLPTRLLDWTTRSYVAAYFAISDALGKCAEATSRLAVWVLNVEHLSLFPELKVLRVPGGNNANLAAQSGRFTLLMTQKESRASSFEGEIALDLYFTAQRLPPPLKKITLPTKEARAALNLCEAYGVTGATLFPDYYGAARATADQLDSPSADGTLSFWQT